MTLPNKASISNDLFLRQTLIDRSKGKGHGIIRLVGAHAPLQQQGLGAARQGGSGGSLVHLRGV